MTIRRTMGATLATSFALLLAASCRDSVPCEPALLGDCCLLDGVHAHPIAVASCLDDEDCPSGTFCGLEGKPCGAGEACCRARPQGRCVPGTSLRADALITGWGVRSLAFQKDRTSAGGTVFKWEVLPTARVTQCALFVCTPVIRRNGCDTDPRIWPIVNYDRCVVAAKTFASDGVFDVNDPGVYASAPGQTDCGRHQAFFPTALVAGCWAFDEDSLIGATELLPLQIAEITGQGLDFTTMCTEGNVGKMTCTLPTQAGHTVLGTCAAEGECGARCLDDCDCLRSGDVPSYTSCTVASGAPVGYCSTKSAAPTGCPAKP